MKLRNNKTGEIVVFGEGIIDLQKIGCNNVAEMLEEGWEDYEEQKEHYFITEYGEVFSLNEYEGLNNVANPEDYKAIGNYFETEEEAEKAVEKLKALTEAKEDGLKIKGYYYNHEDLVILADIGKCNKLTLDTLFGKEID